MISFGSDSPFDPDDPIIGGANKQVTVKANTPGCYKYDAGAFYRGAIYGMSGGNKPSWSSCLIEVNRHYQRIPGGGPLERTLEWTRVGGLWWRSWPVFAGGFATFRKLYSDHSTEG